MDRKGEKNPEGLYIPKILMRLTVERHFAGGNLERSGALRPALAKCSTHSPDLGDLDLPLLSL